MPSGREARTTLSDGRFRISAIQPGVEAALFEAAQESMNELDPWFRSWHLGMTIGDIEHGVTMSLEGWVAGTAYDFAISEDGSDSVLGVVDLGEIDHLSRTANVGYWVRTSQTRRGVASAAVRLLARIGFEDLDLKRSELLIAVENVPSRRVAEKAGAIEEQVLESGLYRGMVSLVHRSSCFALTRP